MKNWQKFSVIARELLQLGIKKTHNRIVLCGLLVGLCYCFFWLKTLTFFTLTGSAFPLLSITAAYLALQELWQQRYQLAKLSTAIAERRLGHSLILFGVALYPFSIAKVWSQALVWLLILVGISLSTWGVSFFQQYVRPFLLLVFSIYPGSYTLVGHLWEALTPQGTMDHFTAWSASVALQMIGQQANAENANINLQTSGVVVGGPCNGFDLAVMMVVTGLLVGIAFKLSRLQSLRIIILGCVLAIALNTIRIALLTIVAVYYDDAVFEFWHGAWGGQIFSLTLFSVYYYLLIKLRLLTPQSIVQQAKKKTSIT